MSLEERERGECWEIETREDETHSLTAHPPNLNKGPSGPLSWLPGPQLGLTLLLRPPEQPWADPGFSKQQASLLQLSCDAILAARAYLSFPPVPE